MNGSGSPACQYSLRTGEPGLFPAIDRPSEQQSAPVWLLADRPRPGKQQGVDEPRPDVARFKRQSRTDGRDHGQTSSIARQPKRAPISRSRCRRAPTERMGSDRVQAAARSCPGASRAAHAAAPPAAQPVRDTISPRLAPCPAGDADWRAERHRAPPAPATCAAGGSPPRPSPQGNRVNEQKPNLCLHLNNKDSRSLNTSGNSQPLRVSQTIRVPKLAERPLSALLSGRSPDCPARRPHPG